jgi:hypothetical protein
LVLSISISLDSCSPAASDFLSLRFFLQAFCALFSEVTIMTYKPALNRAPFSRWTLHDKAALRRLASLYAPSDISLRRHFP